MPRRILQLIGKLKPRKPTRSLPSYKEPTPESPTKLGREEEADYALNNTIFSPGIPALLITLFLLTIFSVPVVQLTTEWRAGAAMPTLRALSVVPSGQRLLAVRTPRDIWNLLPHATELKTAEEAVETESVISQWLLPKVQAALTGTLGAGNEQVYPGRDGWLFYRADVDYVTGPAFLDRRQLRHRGLLPGIQADPVAAILQFRDQLAARGIDLIVMPVPVKPTIDGEMLSPRARAGVLLHNASFAQWKARLEQAGVRVFDPAPLLIERKIAGENAPLYLRTDTHWRADTMRFVAEALAATIAPRGETAPTQLVPLEITATGDVAAMLKLPPSSDLYPPERATIHQVTDGATLWRPSADAEILLLGDSFANIFSLHAMGWGEGAGLAEHLSHALGQPLDCILRNSDAAFATREILSQELARGRDRLAGKKLVVWEFAARELGAGNWKLLEMRLGEPREATFFSPAAGETLLAHGTVAAVSAAPRPGTVPYKDHIVAVHLTDLRLQHAPAAAPLQAMVYMLSIRENTWTPAARLRPGDRIAVRLQPWADVSAQYEKINRTDTDDPALQLEEPVWGELAPPEVSR